MSPKESPDVQRALRWQQDCVETAEARLAVEAAQLRRPGVLNEGKDQSPARREPSPFERFTEIARRIVNVPKAEIDAAEERWKAERAAKRKKKEEDDEHAER